MEEIIFNALVVGLIIGIISGLFILVKSIFEKATPVAKSVADKALKASSEYIKSDSQRISEMNDEYVVIAQREINDGKQVESLWVKAKLSANGDSTKQEIEYIKLRVKNLVEASSKDV